MALKVAISTRLHAQLKARRIESAASDVVHRTAQCQRTALKTIGAP